MKGSSLGRTVLAMSFCIPSPSPGEGPVAISVTDPSIEGVSGGAELDGQKQKISDDGRFVVFRSPGGLLLLPGYVGLENQIFLRDRFDGSVRLVSGAGGSETVGGNGDSREPAISADGSTVVYRSKSTDLVSGETGPVTDNIYLWDRENDLTILVSHVASGSTARGNGLSDEPVVSVDGSSVVFRSRSTDLVAGGSGPNTANIYRWERAGSTTSLVSHAAAQPSVRANGDCSDATLDVSNSQLAFVSSATDLVSGGAEPWEALPNIYRRDLKSGATNLISHAASSPVDYSDSDSYQPVFSADGAWLAFQSWSSDLIAGESGPWRNNIYLWHRDSGVTTLVSHAASQPLLRGNSYSNSPQISADGSVVAFISYSTDLLFTDQDPDESGISPEIYIWDRLTDTTRLVSHATSGWHVRSDGNSSGPAMSGDGASIVYHSDATDLVAQSGGGTGKNIYSWDRATNTSRLVSRSTSGPWVRANGESLYPVINAGGSVVAFLSSANDLVEGDAHLLDLFAAEIATGELELVSERAAGVSWKSITGDGASNVRSRLGSAVSADGRFVVFASRATDLIAGASGGAGWNVYLWDRATRRTTLVSHAAAASQMRGNGGSAEPVISANGAFVVYESGSTDLTVGESGEQGSNIYLWEREAGTTRLVSHSSSSPLVRGNSVSHEPVVSADGSSVAFVSDASDLIPQGSGGSHYNIYHWDRVSNESTLVSHAASGPAVRGDENSYGAVMDAAGSSVAYISQSTDLIAGASGESGFNIYHWHRATNSNTLVSHAASENLVRGNDGSDEPEISSDGAWVAYTSHATDLVADGSGPDTENVYLWERIANANRLVSHAASNPAARGSARADDPSISSDGSSVAYRSRSTDLVSGSNGPVDDNVYLWNRLTDSTVLVSHAANSPGTRGNGGAGEPSIRANGSSLAFLSRATDLVAGGSGSNVYNVYQWDRAKGWSTLVSHSAGDSAKRGNGNSFDPTISANGSTITFLSIATNLVDRDFNLLQDVFSAQPSALFLDGFESGDRLRWSAAEP